MRNISIAYYFINGYFTKKREIWTEINSLKRKTYRLLHNLYKAMSIYININKTETEYFIFAWLHRVHFK
jgi:hypothetical protein